MHNHQVPDCFIDDGDESYKALFVSMKSDLRHYRAEVFDANKGGKLKWLDDRKKAFPNVVLLAKNVMGIPLTQRSVLVVASTARFEIFWVQKC